MAGSYMHICIFAHKMLNDLFSIFATVAKEEDVSENQQHRHKQQGGGNNLKYISVIYHTFIYFKQNSFEE